MIWLFILGIITLATYHRGFRKLVLWALGFCAVFTVYLAVIH